MTIYHRNKEILTALTNNPEGLTVLDLSVFLYRTGGDITKGVSELMNTHTIIKEFCVHQGNGRKTVRYIIQP